MMYHSKEQALNLQLRYAAVLPELKVTALLPVFLMIPMPLLTSNCTTARY